MIGAGDIVRKRVAGALQGAPASELAAICRERAELAEGFAREVGARRWHPHWKALVEDPELDAVYVATPVHVHAEQTIAAAEAGKHVLCEKPMAMHAAECDRMIDACRSNRVALGVAYYRRFYPAVIRIKALLDAGTIGEPVFAQMTASEPFDPRPGAPRYWLVQRAQSGGGPLADFGCHRIELLLHLLGPVERVRGVVANAALDREVEDTAVAVLQFARPATAVVAVTHAAAARLDTFELLGTRGSIRAGSLNSGTMVVRVGDDELREVHPPLPNVHLPVVEDFLDALRRGRAPAVDGQVGRDVAVIQDAIYADTPPVR